ncbi:MAG: acyl-CoA thioesterase-1 [Candidatus Paceibacteria bacterium]|jgi:acyl-CoA thioesterase-1
MKKLSLIVAGLVATITIYFVLSASTQTITNYPSSGTTIVAFGDSLVEGVGSTNGNDFVSQLSRKVDVPIVNLGKRGDTTRDARGRLNDVLESNPKIVLLLLGGNDYLQKIPKEETFSNLGFIIESIHESGAIVIILGVRGGVLKDNFKSDFMKLSKNYGTAHIPNVLDGLIGHPELMSDSIHPNDFGYKIIAERVSPILSSLLK